VCINVKVCFPQKCQHTTAWQGQQQAQLNDYNDYNLRKETAALGHVQSMTRQIAIKDNALGTYEKKREKKRETKIILNQSLRRKKRYLRVG
jgi:hypothetical protein